MKLRVTIILTLMFACCYQAKSESATQERERTPPMITKFDIKWFKQGNKGNSNKTKLLENGDLLTAGTTTGGYYYFCQQSSRTNPYQHYFEYDEEGQLKMTVTSFYKCLVGKRVLYSKNGDSKIAENYDEAFRFSIEDLSKMAEKQYGVDIRKYSPKCWLYRFKAYEKIKDPFYKLVVMGLQGKDKFTEVLIDGTTGEILFSEIRDLQTGLIPEQSTLEKYLDTLK